MLQYEEWRAKHRARCGHFYCEPTISRSPCERFDVGKVHGLNMASVRCQLDRIVRTQQAVRRDESERYFLLRQIDGQTGVRHNGREELLSPGDFLLGDSTRPSEFIFDGRVSEIMSVHIPPSLFLTGGDFVPATGLKVTPQNPLHLRLNALFPDQTCQNPESVQADYFLDLMAMVFGPDTKAEDAGRFRNKHGHVRYATQVIDQHMTACDFSIDTLARLVGQSRR